MEIELKQAQLIDHFVQKAATLDDSSALANLVAESTSHPSLFAFSEILAAPNLLQLQGTENSKHIDLLRLFANGTWKDYKSNATALPPLVPEQVVKLKQLSVLTLAEVNKVLSYEQLLEELEVANVRELEDFLINECMYVGIVRGTLDHLRRCFEVQFAAGRDLRQGQLETMMQGLTNWLDTSDNLLCKIQERIKWAETMCEVHKNHKIEVKNRMQEVKRCLQFKAGKQFRLQQGSFYSDFDGDMDYEEDLSRSKRRWSPRY